MSCQLLVHNIEITTNRGERYFNSASLISNKQFLSEVIYPQRRDCCYSLVMSICGFEVYTVAKAHVISGDSMEKKLKY